MKVIEDYTHLNVSPLQQARLYAQGRPLSLLYRKQRRKIQFDPPAFVDKIDRELTDNYVALDCAGWYFHRSDRQCIAVELFSFAQRYWPDTYIEHDYLSWCPTYLEPAIVLAYYSSYFKYAKLNDLIDFFNIWCAKHKKIIVGLDPTKIKFNYLKFDLLDQITKNCNFDAQIEVLEKTAFNLMFVISRS